MKIMLNYLEIETCSMCNIKCPWCPFGQIPNFRENKLDFLETIYIRKIFNELKLHQFKGVISFQSLNDPLLDERITNGSLFKLCRKILSYDDVKIRINTNGIFLNNSNIENMLSSGLDKLFISCYTDEILNKAKEYKSKYPYYIEILDYTGERTAELKYDRAGIIKSYSKFVPKETTSCTLPIFSSVIGFNGEVRICLNDPLGQLKLGNIKNENLYDILNSEKVRKIRNKIITNRKEVFPCNICNFEVDPKYVFDFTRYSIFGAS